MIPENIYRLIAILRGLNPRDAEAVGGRLIDAGITTLEVPLNRPGALEAIELLVRTFGKQAIIGAGTVLCVDDIDRIKNIGGNLIVSPNCNPAVISATKKANMISVPGIFTATEALTAIGAGADLLKAFPANVLTPQGLKALRAVLPSETPIIPVGSIQPDSFAAWVSAGAAGFGLGSLIFDEKQQLEDIRKRSKNLATQINSLFDN